MKTMTRDQAIDQAARRGGAYIYYSRGLDGWIVLPIAAERELTARDLEYMDVFYVTREGEVNKFYASLDTSDNLKITDIEYRCAINLSRLSDISKEDLAAYWQLCRCYRGQIYIREEAERALKILRCEA